MPALDEANPGVSTVLSVRSVLETLLTEASLSRKQSSIEPALKHSDFPDLFDRLSSSLATATSFNGAPQEPVKTWQFAAIETAARDFFYELIAATPIESPGFVRMWVLLDILSILSDNGQCDPALLFWLVEELLDSQTIAGCRIIFDYLESRRERITAKHFKQKNLVILRSCNELLRRLSRAEDTAFCGRVFIFLFQSFPLGDRSSVNLRGEYHVENVTTFEAGIPGENKDVIDADAQIDVPGPSQEDGKATIKGDDSSETRDGRRAFNPDSLYPSFWSLQESFSQPLKLFNAAHFAAFRSALDETMKAFQAIQGSESSYSFKSVENLRRHLKRKREEGGVPDDNPETFSPRYLTSRDLFELEIGDLSFRRHILVQALIITDFLLSLSAGMKEKLATINASNKAVIYNDRLSEEDTKWATEMKATISDYLRRGYDGAYFFRTVETVLARDKNWVFWKMASCPPIQRDPVSAENFKEAMVTSQRMATNKRLRQSPIGTVSMDFLRGNGQISSMMEKLQSSERYRLPELDEFREKMSGVDPDTDAPGGEPSGIAVVDGNASKCWRALRVASRFNMAAFDRIEDPRKVDFIFEDANEGVDHLNGDADAVDEENLPTDRLPIVMAGPQPATISTLVAMLRDRRKGVFASVVRHTTRQPKPGEFRGKDFHFVTAQNFNQLRDGDRLLEQGTRDGVDYGTSYKAVDAVVDSGKIPILELDLEAALFAKGMDYMARYIFVGPSHAPQDVLAASDAGPFDRTVNTHDGLEKALDSLEAFVYGTDLQQVAQSVSKVADEGDTIMSDPTPTLEAGDGEGEDESDESDRTEDRCIEVKL